MPAEPTQMQSVQRTHKGLMRVSHSNSFVVDTSKTMRKLKRLYSTKLNLNESFEFKREPIKVLKIHGLAGYLGFIRTLGTSVFYMF